MAHVDMACALLHGLRAVEAGVGLAAAKAGDGGPRCAWDFVRLRVRVGLRTPDSL